MTDLIEIHGSCVTFCMGAVYGDHPQTGTPVNDHGELCRGSMGAVRAITDATVYVEPFHVYRHGTYPATAHTTDEWRNDSGVILAVEPLTAGELRLSVGAALELAAHLERSARVALNIDGPHPRIAR